MPSPGTSDFLSVTGTETAPGCRMRTPGGGPGWPSQVPLSCGLKASSQQQSLTPPPPGPSPAWPDSRLWLLHLQRLKPPSSLPVAPRGPAQGQHSRGLRGQKRGSYPSLSPGYLLPTPLGACMVSRERVWPEVLAGELHGGTSILFH